jgi:PhnB protein
MMMTYGESSVAEQMQTERRKRILHTTLAVGNYLLQGADVPSESYQRPQGFSVMLNIEDAAEAERIFNSLSQNGAVQMPSQETFWAMRFGMLVDQFGTPWTINCGKPGDASAALPNLWGAANQSGSARTATSNFE